MLDEFKRDIGYLYNNLNENNLNCFLEKWNIEGAVGDTYQKLQEKEEKKLKGSVYTPLTIASVMAEGIIDKSIYASNPYIKLLDPSCGGGIFLTGFYTRLVDFAKDLGIKNPEKHVVENNLYGVDTDEYAVCTASVEIYRKSGIKSRNISCCDFLFEYNSNVDYVIGNPPYIGHKGLDSEYRQRLAEKFGDVFRDKGDICYCFIKKSYEILNKDGELYFFTSRYFLESLSGNCIREYLKKKALIKSIVDFYGFRVIKGTGVDNIIINIVKNYTDNNSIEYIRFLPSSKNKEDSLREEIISKKHDYSKSIYIKQSELKEDGWVFNDSIEKSIMTKVRGKPLSEVCTIFQGIISGCDKAFVMTEEEAAELDIEKGIARRWIKNKHIDCFNVKESGQVILYTDIIENEDNYPSVIKHMERFRTKLEKRRECVKGLRKWYKLQWGRRKEIFEGKKIVYPYKSERNRFAIDTGSFFSADVYAVVINDDYSNSLTYEYLCLLLNSSLYEFIIKSSAKKLGDRLYEYYPYRLNKIKIPLDIKGLSNTDSSDRVIADYFKLTDDEYDRVMQWCQQN